MYSRYDTYLRINATNLIGFTAPNNWAYTGGLGNLALDCNVGQAFNFNGASLLNQSVYTQTAWSDGTNLSHFGCDLANSNICGAAYNNTVSSFVMNPCAGQGSTFTKRHPNLQEVRSLCDMGYRLRNTPGNSTYGDAPTLSAAAETFIITNYADCSGACVATGYADNFTTNFDQNITINYQGAGGILSNDRDNVGNLITNTGSVNFPILYTPGAGTLTLNAGNFIFDPAITFSGLAIIGYYPRCAGSNVNGNITFVFINVGNPNLPACNVNNSCNENLIQWGDLEPFINEQAMQTALTFDGGVGNPFNFNVGGNGILQDNTPQLCTAGYVVRSCNGNSVPGPALIGASTRALKIVFRRISDSNGNSTNAPEGPAFHLCRGIAPGMSGTISFRALVAANCVGQNPTVRAEFTNVQPIGGQIIGVNPGITSPIFSSGNINTPAFTIYNINFNNNTTNTWNYLALSSFVGATNFPNPGMGDIILDDISLILTGQTSLNITAAPSTLNPFTGCGFTINYQVCNPSATTASAAFNLQIQLPAGITHTPNASFPTLNIQIPALAAGACSNVLTLSLNVDNNTTLAGTPLTISAIPANNVCFNTNQSITTVTPQLYPITFSKTSSTTTPVNGVDFTFNFQLCNRVAAAQTVTMNDAVPANLTITNINGWTQAGQNMSRTVNISGGTQANPFCQNYSFTVRPNYAFTGATQCAYQSANLTNTATAQFTGSTCNAVASSVNLTIYSHRVIGSTVNIPTVSQAIAQGMLLSTANSTSTGQTFTIDGNFNVDINYDFGNGSNTVQSFASCRPGSLVTVNSNCKLSGYYLQFNACTQLWRGILVTGSGVFAPPAGELLLSNSQVNDAQYGVQLSNLSKISITNSQFRECFVGLYFPYSSINASIVTPVPFAANTFFSAGNLRQPYPGMANASNQPTPAQIPVTNRRTWAGIHLNYVASFTNGNTSYAYSWFNGISNGIVSDNTNLSVVNSAFQNINAYGYNFNSIQGNGIYGTANLQLIIGGNPYAGIGLYQRGMGTSTQNFSNCDRAIVTNQMSVDIANNKINAALGIKVSGAKYGNIKIINNSIGATANSCIALSNNDPVNSMEVATNGLATNSTLAAFDIQEVNNAPVVDVKIHHNKITMGSGTFVGLNLNGGSGINSTTFNYKVYNNTVIMDFPATALSGISFSNSHFIESYNNLVTGPVSGNTIQNSIFSGYPTGIQYSTSDGKFNCDSVTRTYNGIKIFGTCNGSFTGGTKFSGCVMNAHTFGFYQTSGATIPPQGNSSTSLGNRWRGSFATNSARNDNSTLNKIFVKGTTLPYWPAASGAVFPSAGWFDASTGNPSLCSTPVGAGFKTDEEENNLNGLEELVLADSLHFEDFEDPLKWQNEKALYEKLKSNTDLLQIDEVVEEFYEAKQNSIIGELSAVEDGKKQALQPAVAQSSQLNNLLTQKEIFTEQLVAADTLVDSTSTPAQFAHWAQVTEQIHQQIESTANQLIQLQQQIDENRLQQLDIASAANQSVQGSEQIENNTKQFNEVYFNTVAKNIYTFTAAELSVLNYLAYQCPLAGGEAVYRARSLLSLVASNFYNDKEICLAAGIAYKKGKEEEAKKLADQSEQLLFSTFPNPANNYLILQSNLASDELFAAKVYDNLGRIVAEQTFSLGNKRYRMSTDHLSQGIYYIRLYKNADFIHSDKFTIHR